MAMSISTSARNGHEFGPSDWASPYRDVVSDTYYMLTDRPNLHHIFPSNFIASNPGKSRVDVNSLMNIAYITQLTNIRISDKNPIDYIAELDKNEFRTVLRGHLVPSQIVDWAHEEARCPRTRWTGS